MMVRIGIRSSGTRSEATHTKVNPNNQRAPEQDEDGGHTYPVSVDVGILELGGDFESLNKSELGRG